MGAPASEARPALSILIPSRDRPEMLARCLASVAAAAGPDDEIIVIDSASVDAAAVVAAALAAGARLVRCDLPGVCRARNAGWRAARHDLLAFTDDDVVVDAGWADAFARVAAAHPEAAFVSGRISVPAGQEGGSREVAIKDDPEPAVLTAASTGDLGHSASLLVRGSTLAGVGGWDEALGAGGRFRSAPEVDLYDRVFATGATGRYEPAARAWHDQWRERRDLVRLDLRYGTGLGARLAKLVRTDRARARHVLIDSVWRWNRNEMVGAIRHRNKTALLLVIVRSIGTVGGFVAALGVPVRDGHLRPRRP